jgi:hypothetical protein
MEFRQLSLVKGAHKFVFRYTPGSEAEVIGAFTTLVERAGSEFDWFDAAVLSYQIGKQMGQDLEEMSKSV